MRDDTAIAELSTRIDRVDDEPERPRLRQKLLDLQHPPLERYEAAFVEHVKAWADDGVSADAFVAEDVPAGVLRRAGLRNVTDGGQRRNSSHLAAGGSSGRRRPVTADEVRAAIPLGQVHGQRCPRVQRRVGWVVRRVIRGEVKTANVTDQGPDPDRTGPGRVPTV